MENQVQKIHFALDLGFSDYFEGENVRQTTIQSKSALLEQAVRIMQAEEAINFSLLESLSNKHPSPQIYALDFPSDLRASFYLLLGGYYRQAVMCLRNWLEMRMLGVYFGLVDQVPSKYEDWKLGKSEAPFGRVLIRRLFARAEFQDADSKYDLKERIKNLYSDLSEFTHGGGVEKYNLQANTDNVPRYNGTSVDLWFTFMNRTFGEIVFCMFTAYADRAFSCIQPDEVRTILASIPEKYRRELQSAIGG